MSQRSSQLFLLLIETLRLIKQLRLSYSRFAESSGSEEEDEVDEEIEQPKERQQASRKAETGEDGPKGRRNVAKKPVMVKTKAKPNQRKRFV